MGRWFTGCLSVLAILVVAKAYTGWHQARTDAPDLIVEAASLIAQGRGAHDLGPGRVEWHAVEQRGAQRTGRIEARRVVCPCRVAQLQHGESVTEQLLESESLPRRVRAIEQGGDVIVRARAVQRAQSGGECRQLVVPCRDAVE